MESNQSNSSSSTMTPYQIAGTIVYTLICISGLIGYGIYCYVVIKHRKQLANPFYAFTVSLAIPECIGNLTTLIYGIPSMTPYRYTSFIIRDLCGFLEDYCWFLLCWHVVLIACNRSIALKWHASYKTLFSPRRTALLILTSYVITLIIPVCTYACSCRFDFIGVAWTVACDESAETCSSVVMLLDSIASNTQLAFVLLCNGFTLAYVAKKSLKMKAHTQQQTQGSSWFKREKNLVLQFAAIALVMILGEICFWVLPYMAEKGFLSGEAAEFASNTMIVVQNSINPFLYFTFSSKIRKYIWKGSGEIKPATTTQTAVRSVNTVSAPAVMTVGA